MSSILDTPWIPTINNQTIGRHEAYDSICGEGAVPDSFQHGAWSEKTHSLLLANVPEGRDAQWECVLALWRLRQVKGEGMPSEIWKMHVVAWLVSRLVLVARPWKLIHLYR